MRIIPILILSASGLAFAAQQPGSDTMPQTIGAPEPDDGAQEAGSDISPTASGEKPRPSQSGYILGPGDQISVRAVDLEEINDKPIFIDTSGYLHPPMVGAIYVTGMSIADLELELSRRLKKYLVHPDVSVSVLTFKSQPVSVVGAVKTPGVYQLEGRKTVMEMLSLAGGLDAYAGTTLKMSRRLETGRIPLKSAVDDQTGQFSVATLDLKSLLEARDPADNILVQPHDVITVPRAEMVYVIGDVQKAGGFTLSEHENITVLKALSLAGGLDRTAAAGKARLIRRAQDTAARSEIPVNVKAILEGKASDVTMHPQDILFIPTNGPKKLAARAAETALQIGTGVVIFRR